MADPVLDFISAELAALQRIVPLQLPPYGYGTDLSCTSDLTPDMAETDPNSLQGLAEMLVRWLTTDRGSVADAPERGFNIRRLIGKGMTPDDIRSAQAQICNEATEDDRIDSAACNLEVVNLTAINIRLRCKPKDPKLGGFALVLGVTTDNVLYNLITGEA